MNEKLTESEAYSIIANVPYRVFDGEQQKDIERDLEAWGLKYKIDEDLSDKDSVVLHNEDEAIHSIRGSRTLLDWANNLEIGSGLEKALNTLAAKPYLYPKLRKQMGEDWITKPKLYPDLAPRAFGNIPLRWQRLRNAGADPAWGGSQDGGLGMAGRAFNAIPESPIQNILKF